MSSSALSSLIETD